MSSSTYPDVLPVPEASAEPLQVERQFDVRRQPPRGGFVRGVARWLVGLAGLLWRWVVGAGLCMNHFTAVFVAGWVYRWMQGHVLHNWWRQSAHAKAGTFRQFCDSMGRDAPVPRPRWFWRERIGATLSRPAPNGQPAGVMRKFFRLLTVPWHSLWLNFKIGVAALFCTYLFTGWGLLLMVSGWEGGWLNSFFKGYELSGVGPGVSLLGIALFILALYYVLMAQVHQAVVNERMAFFDFKFIWKLIQARPTAYCMLIVMLTLVSLPLEILKFALLAPPMFSNNESLSDYEVFEHLVNYTFLSCLFFFAMLVFVRRLAANVYSSAVLKVLRRGNVSRAELHPKIRAWLERLEICPVPLAGTGGIIEKAAAGAGRLYRWKIYVLIFLVGFVFVSKRYVGEFLLYHPVMGFLNHELVQLPSFDLITGTPAGQAGFETIFRSQPDN